MSHHAAIDVVVSDVVEVNSLIKRFHFKRTDGNDLPAFSGGAHIVIEMQDGDQQRRTPYSLMSSPFDTSNYQVSIRRDDNGRGGSLYMHREVTPGMAMRISYPANLFPLDLRANKHLLIAGGIGITPFLAQCFQLDRMDANYELHYGVRSPELGAYLDELSNRLGHRLHTYFDDQQQSIDFNTLLNQQPVGTHLYVCGPTPMIDKVLESARDLGWPDVHIHFEHFAKSPPGEPFSVELANSGIAIEVGREQSMLEAIEAAGIDAPYLCRGGACGQCETNVLSHDGELLHEDHWLDDEERANGKKIMPCVSRFKGQRLVLER
ncbi:MAG: 2Fe-2S iron-sulfur cluster-binding protein [Granulosicoccus sp.]